MADSYNLWFTTRDAIAYEHVFKTKHVARLQKVTVLTCTVEQENHRLADQVGWSILHHAAILTDSWRLSLAAVFDRDQQIPVHRGFFNRLWVCGWKKVDANDLAQKHAMWRLASQRQASCTRLLLLHHVSQRSSPSNS